MATQSHGQLAMTLEQLLSAKEVVVTCGAGGVGKTTTAAALATMAAIHLGGRVLVLTIDPARRLADALGLDGIGNEERPVSPDAFTAAGLKPRGELWAAMLDTKASWDDLIRRHAPDTRTRDAILANPLYDNITARFVQSHDYIAMERLHELHSSGRYDLIVVDTPPSRNALDFLDAPDRMEEFFGGRLLRWLTAPMRNRVVGVASRPFLTVADRVLGARFLQDIAEFFVLLQSMEKGFVSRARAVGELMADNRSTFCVVTTLEAAPAQEASFFVDELHRRHLSLGAVIVNKALPEWLLSDGPSAVAQAFRDDPTGLAGAVSDTVGAPRGAARRVLREVGESFGNYAVVATREAEQRVELTANADVLVSIPMLDEPVNDLASLVHLGQCCWR
ncbi:MAG TPA: ArsA-related P-loop ATPase [Acidimicrobiales bacterium]